MASVAVFIALPIAAVVLDPPKDKTALAEKVLPVYAQLRTLSYEVRLDRKTQRVLVGGKNEKQRLDFRVTMAQGGKFRIEAFENGRPFATVVGDGDHIYEWESEHNRWTTYEKSWAEDQGLGLGYLVRYRNKYSDLMRFYSDSVSGRGLSDEWLKRVFASPLTKLKGTAKVDGRRCDLLEYHDKDALSIATGSETVELYFDQETHFLIKKVQRVKGAAAGIPLMWLYQRWLYRNIRPNAKLPEDAFHFTPPEGSTFVLPEEIKPRTPSLDGQPAPAFTLPAVKGGKVSLADFKDQKPVLLVFWATWCRPCRQEMPMLIKLHREFGDQGLAVIGVSIDDTTETIKSFLKGNPLPYTILHDATDEVSQSYHASGVPHTVLIDKSGKVVKTWRGWGGEEEEKEIRAELAKLGLGPPAASRPAADGGE